jgi:hypothetical protein
LSAALQTLVEGAQTIFEMQQVEWEITVPINLVVLDSSCHHALLIQDLSEHSDSWRHPILITKDFLFNPRKMVKVTRCHAMSGIIVHRERLCIQWEQPSFTDSERYSQATAWDTIIKVRFAITIMTMTIIEMNTFYSPCHVYLHCYIGSRSFRSFSFKI